MQMTVAKRPKAAPDFSKRRSATVEIAEEVLASLEASPGEWFEIGTIPSTKIAKGKAKGTYRAGNVGALTVMYGEAGYEFGAKLSADPKTSTLFARFTGE